MQPMPVTGVGHSLNLSLLNHLPAILPHTSAFRSTSAPSLPGFLGLQHQASITAPTFGAPTMMPNNLLPPMSFGGARVYSGAPRVLPAPPYNVNNRAPMD